MLQGRLVAAEHVGGGPTQEDTGELVDMGRADVALDVLNVVTVDVLVLNVVVVAVLVLNVVTVLVLVLKAVVIDVS